MNILSPDTDNCPSWISEREEMTVENISWSISTKECCRPSGGRTRNLLITSRTCIQLSHHRGRLLMMCLKTVANSVDPDQTPQSAASEMGLHCLLRPVCPNTWGKYDIQVFVAHDPFYQGLAQVGRVKAQMTLWTAADSAYPDQPMHPCNLIRAFAVHLHNHLIL